MRNRPIWQIQKIAVEGTSEPLVARLTAGTLELRDILLNHLASDVADRELRQKHFDERYTPVLDAIGAARTYERASRQILNAHREKIANGLIIARQHNILRIRETINASLQDHFAVFLYSTVRAVKLLQDLLAYMDVEIGILFQKRTRFEAGMQQLRSSGNVTLADYLTATRNEWSEILIERRNLLEHKGWRLPDVRYMEQLDGLITVDEPHVDGRLISEFMAGMLDRMMTFIEDMLAYAVQRGIADIGDLIDIPKDRRDPGHVKRFQFGIPSLQPDETFWTLRYSERGFADS